MKFFSKEDKSFGNRNKLSLVNALCTAPSKSLIISNISRSSEEEYTIQYSMEEENCKFTFITQGSNQRFLFGNILMNMNKYVLRIETWNWNDNFSSKYKPRYSLLSLWVITWQWLDLWLNTTLWYLRGHSNWK